VPGPCASATAAQSTATTTTTTTRSVHQQLAAERWYIGGRTAGGEERYYKLGLVRVRRSEDRLSLDRLSL